MSNTKDVTVLFPGSFNPIHIGHLALANHICEFIPEVSAFWFLVTPRNPFKEKKDLLPDPLRKEWVRTAIQRYKKFDISTIEDTLPQPNYTLNTILALKKKYPNREFVLLMGADNLQDLPGWYKIHTLLREIEIWVYPRPGYSNNVPKELQEYKDKIRHISAPIMEISSTYIRDALRSDKTIPYFLAACISNDQQERVKEWLKEQEKREDEK